MGNFGIIPFYLKLSRFTIADKRVAINRSHSLLL